MNTLECTWRGGDTMCGCIVCRPAREQGNMNMNTLESILINRCPSCGVEEQSIRLLEGGAEGAKAECVVCHATFYIGSFYAVECTPPARERDQRSGGSAPSSLS